MNARIDKSSDFAEWIRYSLAGAIRPFPIEGGVAFLQKRLEGSWRDDIDAHFVAEIATLNELQTGFGDREGPWQETFEQTLGEGGRGWCRHDVVALHSPATRRVVELAKVLARNLPELPDGDVVHFDLHHRNVLRTDHGLSGVIDWEGARSGDRKFDLVTLYCGLAVATCELGVADALHDRVHQEVRPETLLIYAVHMTLRLLDWAISSQPTLSSTAYSNIALR